MKVAIVSIVMATMTKQKLQAFLYYMLVILAVYITGCRNNRGVIDENGNTSAIRPPSSLVAQFTTAGEAGVASLATSTPVIKVTWVNPTYNASEYTIQIEYKKSSETSFHMFDLDLDTSHIIYPVDETLDYNIRLKATTEDGDSSEYVTTIVYADNSGASCPIAVGLDASVASPSQVNLTWMWSNNDFFVALNSYVVQRKLITSSTWVDVKTTVVNGTPSSSYSDVSVIAGEIHYRIVSHCGANQSSSTISDSVVATVALPIPDITSAVPWGTNQNRITWTYAGTAGANGHNGYQIKYEVSNGASGYFLSIAPTTNIYIASLSDTVCPVGQTVTYQVRATRLNQLLSSQWSAPFQVSCP